jgi:hypothetical protein
MLSGYSHIFQFLIRYSFIPRHHGDAFISMNTKKSAELKITGYIEVIVRDTVYGWVTVDPTHFSLHVLLDEIIIGRTDSFLERPDLAATHRAKGFSIKCEKSVTSSDLINGRLKVVAINFHNIVSLPIWAPLQEASVLTNIDLDLLGKGLKSVPSAFLKKIAHEIGLSNNGRSFGRISRDGFAQVGRNGHLFLASGRNRLSKFYTNEIKIDIEAWIACFIRRQEILNRLKTRYVQIIIPEKSSVLYSYVPYPVTGASAPYLDLIQCGLKNNIPICGVFDELLEIRNETPPFSQGDTHLNTFGAENVVKTILKFLSEDVLFLTSRISEELRVGDLAERFAEDGDIQELIPIYKNLYFSEVNLDPELTYKFDPENGHQGRRRIWRNSSAPIKKKVVCFGNSFFELGENSCSLSWWFARLFSEFHFVWSPVFDVGYVEKVLPDIVICQSIERFLTEVPAD